jgi:hypothetical protein
MKVLFTVLLCAAFALSASTIIHKNTSAPVEASKLKISPPKREARGRKANYQNKGAITKALSAEDAIAGVAEAGDDVTMLV